MRMARVVRVEWIQFQVLGEYQGDQKFLTYRKLCSEFISFLTSSVFTPLFCLFSSSVPFPSQLIVTTLLLEAFCLSTYLRGHMIFLFLRVS